MKKKRILLPLLATVLIIAAAINPSLAYFTANAHAKGGYPIRQGTTTTVDERFDDWTKHVTIKNTEGVPVYVRARAFAGAEYQEGLRYTGKDWESGGDGWWYYSSAVAEGQTTAELNIEITKRPVATENADFNVIVVYEATPVQYDEHGNPATPQKSDWEMAVRGEQG